MRGAACAAAAADLTELAARLERAGRALARQATLPDHEFGGLSGEAFRHHVAGSSGAAVDTAAAVAGLAGALAALGRGLESADQLRERAASADPDPAARLLERAARAERRAQDGWRDALGRFDGAVNGTAGTTGTAVPPPAQPVVSHPPLHPAESTGVSPDPGAVAPPPPPGSATPAAACGTQDVLDDHR